MNNLETLKQELLNQKQAIESKGGSVFVANSNPSPAEITSGIKNIPLPDFSMSTATEQDVLQGKTFYSGSSTLKTGEYVSPEERYKHLFENVANVQTSSTEYRYAIPSYLTETKNYMFGYNSNNITIDFHSGIETLGSYMFYLTPNFKFSNFEDMVNLKEIKTYCFAESNAGQIDLEAIPESVVDIESRAFYHMTTPGCSIRIPHGLTVLDSFCFANKELIKCNNFYISEDTPIKTFSANLLQNLNFNCDLTTPTSVTSIASKFLYNGSFNNIVLGQNILNLASNCFNADSTVALADITLKTVTFERVSPPVIATNVFSSQAVSNGLKIYVPDESYEAYLAKLSNFASCVHRISEKD